MLSNNQIRVLGQPFISQKTLPTLSHLRFESVSCNSCPNLHEEDDAKQDGEGESHAVVLLDRTAASKECNKENNASYALFFIILPIVLYCKYQLSFIIV